MIFTRLQLGLYKVSHESGYVCGKIEFDNTWSEFNFMPSNCGLNCKDLKQIYKFMNKLNRKYT